DVDVAPIGEAAADRLVRRRVVVAERAQGLVGEHHAEAEGVVGAVALVDRDLPARPSLLREQREVQPARSAADNADLHSAAVSRESPPSPRSPGAPAPPRDRSPGRPSSPDSACPSAPGTRRRPPRATRGTPRGRSRTRSVARYARPGRPPARERREHCASPGGTARRSPSPATP